MTDNAINIDLNSSLHAPTSRVDDKRFEGKTVLITGAGGSLVGRVVFSSLDGVVELQLLT